MTVIELIERASARLEQAGVSFGQGTTNAFDEAAWLVLWRLGLPLDALDHVAEQPVDETKAATVDALIAQRIDTRRPSAYLTGEAWLQGVPFAVDERTIVPRSLIAEVLNDGTLDAWLQTPPVRVLDLCTGNGSLAVLAAMRWPAAAIDAADVSTDALKVAEANLERHDLADRITLHHSDGFEALRDRYDLIVCNPPYVNAQSMAALPPEFQAEPALALAGGDDGMDFIQPMLQRATEHLQPQGLLVLEIGHERERFDAAFPSLDVVGLPSSEGDDAVLLITRDALEKLP
ncbi:MAG TPA: 50S ribosomal protein L3 N(5)-glutamine methyltransferase [Burkholderiaceae bacterium]|nr:50S ribosomal protein L3 N(5)-glutamine methyltransferase [Burkholderiaceae bacterium]